ncbi:MAG: alpha-mannosidase [Thermoproteota archaeon]
MDGRKIRIHMVGNAHIDPIWLWSWQEGYRVVRSTFRKALDLMNEFNFFVFTASSAAFYEWIEASEPEMFREMRRRIKERRWEVTGGWIVEPDCNIPSGESFVRQALYGQRYFRKKFGIMVITGFNIDSFGHNGMLPQILSKCGLKNYVFMRPGVSENKDIPESAFWWEGYDGSRVLCYRLPLAYCTSGGDITDHIDRTISKIKPPFTEAMCFYGVGDHGGGPTRENILSILRRREKGDVEIVFSSLDEFFSRVRRRQRLPVFHGEMQHHARGCYSAHSEVKRNNRRAEELLCTAEKIASAAYLLLGKEYPQKDLTRAWKNLLFTQFHDALCGTSIPEAYEDIRNIHGEVLNTGGAVLNKAVQAIASKINTEGEGIPIIVFNPHSWNTVSPVEVEDVDGEGSLTDENGQAVLMQRVKSSANVGDWRQRIVFIADVPALGYRVYRNTSKKNSLTTPMEGLVASDNLLENEWVRLEIDPANGYIKRLHDKRNRVEVFRKDSCIPVVVEDQSDTWSHGVDEFRKDVGTFGNANVKLVEKGPVRATIRVESSYNKSFMRMHVSIYRGLPYVELRFSLNWNEQHKMLKLSFTVNVDQPVLASSIPYGWAKRPCNGEEEPMHKWVDMAGRIMSVDGETKDYGLSICNDCKYSYDAKGSEIRITVLRSPPYAHHQPYKLDPSQTYSYIDQGWQDFNLMLIPHAGSWKPAYTVRHAEELNSKPIVFVDYPHKGILPPRCSLIQVNQDSLIVSVLKKHEDSGNLVMRLYETNGEETEAVINLLSVGKRFKARFKPFEIKTILIPKARGRIKELGMLELARRK